MTGSSHYPKGIDNSKGVQDAETREVINHRRYVEKRMWHPVRTVLLLVIYPLTHSKMFGAVH